MESTPGRLTFAFFCLPPPLCPPPTLSIWKFHFFFGSQGDTCLSPMGKTFLDNNKKFPPFVFCRADVPLFLPGGGAPTRTADFADLKGPSLEIFWALVACFFPLLHVQVFGRFFLALVLSSRAYATSPLPFRFFESSLFLFPLLPFLHPGRRSGPLHLSSPNIRCPVSLILFLFLPGGKKAFGLVLHSNPPGSGQFPTFSKHCEGLEPCLCSKTPRFPLR